MAGEKRRPCKRRAARAGSAGGSRQACTGRHTGPARRQQLDAVPCLQQLFHVAPDGAAVLTGGGRADEVTRDAAGQSEGWVRPGWRASLLTRGLAWRSLQAATVASSCRG